MSGVPARTIRFYQSKGALPKPRRQGRVAFYDDGHRERLQLIGELQDRGLKLAGIRDLLSHAGPSGRTVSDWLGVDEVLRGPWSEDQPRVLSGDELSALLGDRRPGLVAELERADYVQRQADGQTWLVPSPTLLELALGLHDAGINIELTSAARDLLRRRLARAADDLVDLFTDWDDAPFGPQLTTTGLAEAVTAMRPIAREAAGVILAQEIERALRRLVESPKPTDLLKKRVPR